jgi:hypothetical protein
MNFSNGLRTQKRTTESDISEKFVQYKLGFLFHDSRPCTPAPEFLVLPVNQYLMLGPASFPSTCFLYTRYDL